MKRKFVIKDGVFKGETYQQYNGAIVTEAVTKDGDHMEGRSGTTKAYDTSNGGRLFLSDAQVDLV